MPLSRTYTTPAAPSTIQPASTTTGKAALRRPFSGGIRAIALILTSVISAASAQEPPENLARLVAHRESQTEAERNQYLYRQTVTIDELDDRGAVRGQYKEVRDIIFSPAQERTEESVGKPLNSLKNLIMTPEDFRDIRDIQPLVLTEDRLWNYETRFKGEETVDGVDCWVLQVRPRQILGDLRFFDGLVWVDKKEYNIIRMQGQAVPQIHSLKQENLFPRFTTLRKAVDGKHWFPVYTYADDTLHFRTGPQRERLRIAYSNYKRFGVESTFTPK